jgi:hypothetical protein
MLLISGGCSRNPTVPTRRCANVWMDDVPFAVVGWLFAESDSAGQTLCEYIY